jgi:F-type H+-transporting ATPase subunit alpha
MIDETLLLFVSTKGYLANVYLEKVQEFESTYITYVKAHHPEAVEQIEKDKKISDDTAKILAQAAEDCLKVWKNA